MAILFLSQAHKLNMCQPDDVYVAGSQELGLCEKQSL
jgi:hypothetical protein